MKKSHRLLAFSLLALPLTGCIVYDVASVAVTTVATVATVGVKVVGAAAGAVIPDGDDEEKKDNAQTDKAAEDKKE